MYFEMYLKIVRDGGEVEDFSKGVIVFNKARLPNDKQTMGVSLNSYLSRVEVRCAYVVHPIEATIEVNILPPGLPRIMSIVWIFTTVVKQQQRLRQEGPFP